MEDSDLPLSIHLIRSPPTIYSSPHPSFSSNPDAQPHRLTSVREGVDGP